MDENLMLFSKRIKMLRLEKEWSQDVLAEKLGGTSHKLMFCNALLFHNATGANTH